MLKFLAKKCVVIDALKIVDSVVKFYSSNDVRLNELQVICPITRRIFFSSALSIQR